MKNFLAFVCILMLGLTLVSEANARRGRGGDDDNWRRRGDTNRRGPQAGRDRRNGGGDRDYRRPPVNNDRRDRDYRRPTPPRRDDNWRGNHRRHAPHRRHQTHTRRFSRRDYHRSVPPRYIFRDRWVRYSAPYGNGYIIIDGYPFFVYNGYRHRYSSYDTCDFDLVDSYSDYVERTFYGYTCAQAYDYCADLRDDLNWNSYGDRYFCSERYQY